MILFKYFQLAQHLLRAVVLLAFVFPFLSVKNQRIRVSKWSKKLLTIFQIYPEYLNVSLIPQSGGLLISNHISWIDIFLINSHQYNRFVAKSEVASWPLFGWFANRINTLFIDRNSKSAIKHINAKITECLNKGEYICIFPEGTSTDGKSILPFKSNLLQSVLNSDKECIPLAITYEELHSGDPSTSTAFIGDMTLLESIDKIMRSPPIVAKLIFLPPCLENEDRKKLAIEAKVKIEQARNNEITVS